MQCAAMTENPKSLFIATPAYGCLVCKDYLTSLILLRVRCAANGIRTMVKLLGNESLITRARNVLVAEFLRSPCTHLMFIDSDIHFNPDTVVSMLAADRPVLCGIYGKKSFNWDNLHDPAFASEPVHQRMVEFNLNLKPGCRVEENRFVEVMDAATGFMMIRRDVLETMCSRYPELLCVNDIPWMKETVPTYCALFDCMIDPVDRRYLSEDYAFCRRWQKLGGTVWADLSCALGHIGTFTFSARSPLILEQRDIKPSSAQRENEEDGVPPDDAVRHPSG
jgi:hypothetical protein